MFFNGIEVASKFRFGCKWVPETGHNPNCDTMHIQKTMIITTWLPKRSMLGFSFVYPRHFGFLKGKMEFS
jgi:hypothetical protein